MREVDVPEGEPAVCWRLVTPLPIDTPEQIARVVDTYRARWMVEELFKALKTGCAFELHQLSTYTRLTKLLAVLLTRADKGVQAP